MTILSRPDLDFLLHDWLEAESLASLPRFAGQGRADYDAVLDLAEKIGARFATSWKGADRDEPRLSQDGAVTCHPPLVEGVRDYLAAGLQLAAVDEAHGGMQLPYLVATAVAGTLMCANVSAAAFPMLSNGNARVVRDCGTPAQIEAFAAPQHRGEALGTMCLSEPDVGSSLGDIATRAQEEGEDALGRRFRLSGKKMWISGGDHDVTGQIVHLVLAKIANADGSLPAGTAGISLFLVPKVLPDGSRNDVIVAGLNHKMGYRGIPNTLLNFGEGAWRPGDAPGAVGWLVGGAGEGLAIMFRMMNEARINVGLGAAALACRGHLASRAYARERVQGRPLEDKRAKDPVPLTRHPDVRRMLLAQRAIGEGALAVCLYAAKLSDLAQAAGTEAERARAELLLGILTPVAKTWPSEMGLAANHHAIQIHGGYGYTRDFDVEQIYRDNRLNPIHEGTTGIQGLDLLGRKILFDRSGAFAALMEEMRGAAARASALPQAAVLLAEIARIEHAVEAARGMAPPEALAHGTGFLSAFGHLVIAWLWLDMARVAGEKGPGASAEARLWSCRHFYSYEVPMIAAWLAPLLASCEVSRAAPEAAL